MTSASAFEAKQLVAFTFPRADFHSLSLTKQAFVNVRLPNESLDQYYARLREKSDREDMVMFVNACFAATSQHEFYSDSQVQSVSIDFLHQYVLANFRTLYARVLSTGINHFNQAFILFHLLRSGAPVDPSRRLEEGRLIEASIRGLPVNRVLNLIRLLKKHRVNNRRTRATIGKYLAGRQDPVFDSVKYRNKVRMAVTHAHLKRDGEMGNFLFRFKKQKGFDTELFDRYRQAHYSASAIYELPFTVAESLIQKHNIPRDLFLKKIEHKMTAVEKLRLQTSNAKVRDTRLDFDLSRAPLTKLALYIMSLPMNERIERGMELHEAMSGSAARAIASTSLKLGRVATVLDRSRSSRGGSRQKRNRPLAVVLAASYLLREAATEYQSFWTVPLDLCNDLPIDAQEILVTSAGQTSLADPLIDALQWQPDVLIIVSDGFENSPPMAANQVVGAFRNRLQRPEQTMEIIHMNPVFDVDHFAPRPLGDSMATVGLRDAEDIPTMMGFARFARGSTPIAELETFLEMRMHSMLGAAKEMP